MINQAAVANIAVAHHADRTAIVPAGHVKGITAQSTHQLHVHVRAGAVDVEMIVPFQRIHYHLLNPIEGHKQAAAVDARRGHDKVIPEFSPNYRQGVEAIATFYRHGRIDGVGDEVSALAAIDVRKRRLGILGIYPDKSADDEGIVVFFTEKVQRFQVVVNGEGVITDTAKDGRGITDAVAQVTLGSQDGIELVLGCEARMPPRGDLNNCPTWKVSLPSSP